MAAAPEFRPDRAHLDALRPLVEAVVGRQLRTAEQVVDVFRITRLLDQAKDELDRQIRREQTRAVHRTLRTGGPVRLQLRAVMLDTLAALYQAGRDEAMLELERAGYSLPGRGYAADPRRDRYIERAAADLRRRLQGLAIRIHNEHVVQLQIHDEGPVADALARALIDVLGARSIAADLVSTAMFAGMGATFEDASDLVDGWEYSAVLDGGTCDECAPLDGTTYPSWDAIQEVLPDGGPNPACLGGGRCRCRAVPA